MQPNFGGAPPCSNIRGPALWVVPVGLGVDATASGEDLYVAALVSVVRRDEAKDAVQVLVVIPTHEARDPGKRVLESAEALSRVAGPVRECAEERLDVGVVVADMRATERRHDAQQLHRAEHR